MNRQNLSVWIGFDPREAAAYAVSRLTFGCAVWLDTPIRGVVLSDLERDGVCTRPREYRPSQLDSPVLWDVISDAPMSTQHACARFLVPKLNATSSRCRWAMFADGDTMVRADTEEFQFLVDSLSEKQALYCVKHRHDPVGDVKMDGQVQTRYARKNWSSVVIFNCDHPSNAPLIEGNIANELPGRDLHRFCWLRDEEIGGLGPEWNYLVGATDSTVDAKIVHFTEGTPDMRGYENCEYAGEWRERLAEWAG